MYARLSQAIYRFRWWVVAAWLALTAAALLGLPNLNKVVAHTHTDYIPNNSTVVEASHLVKQIDTKHGANSTAVIAIHNGHGLTAFDRNYFRHQLSEIDAHRGEYGVTYVQGPNSGSSKTNAVFISKDKTTEIATVGLRYSVASDAMEGALNRLHQVFAHAPSDAKVYFTGDAPLQQDEIAVSMAGVEKTAYITVALVLVILLLVFRSIVAPLVTLLAVGLTYLITTGLVAWLAGFGLPVSSFTQTFLIAVLFGAGTDYSIIILNRYREELGRHPDDPAAALTHAVSAIGKTVLFSGLTVLTSFAVLYLAHFGLYRSGVGVAVGVAVLIVLCFSFIPALIGILGPRLFWPRRIDATNAHRPSRVWGFTGGLALRRPWWTLLCLLAVLTPLGLLFTNPRSFDPLGDIPGADSAEGFRTVSQAFGSGTVMPVDIILRTDKNLRSSQGLATIEKVSESIAALPGVSKVDSATRPEGEVIHQFQLATENRQAASGLASIQDGLGQLSRQLHTAAQGMAQGAAGSAKLTQGAKQVEAGAGQLANGLTQAADQTQKLSSGAKQLAHGAEQLQAGMNRWQQGARQVNHGAQKLAGGADQLAAGLNGSQGLAQGIGALAADEKQLAGANAQLVQALRQWMQTHPAEAASPSFQAMLKLAEEAAGGQAKAATASQKLATGAKTVGQAAQQLQQGAHRFADELDQLTRAAGPLANATVQLHQGTEQLASGSQALASGINRLNTGAQSLNTGTAQVATGLGALAGNLTNAPDELTKASQGAAKLAGGVKQATNFLHQSGAAAQGHGSPGFYVPASTIRTNAQLAKAMNAYISRDGHLAKFSVVLKANPYSSTAIRELPDIEQAGQSALAASPIRNGDILAAGTTAQQAELNRISSQDFIHTVVLILSVIFLLLVIMLRSILAPLYIIASLAGTYFVTMAGLQLIFVDILGKTGLNWVVPFFVFLILVALGVDYSIFLMTRFEEERQRTESVADAMHTAMKQMGAVVFSAAVIMGGTFGSMIATGVASLVEIASAVMLGLFLYALVMLAFFVPASARVIGQGHTWPFRSQPDSGMVERSSSPGWTN
ncbi:MMPL family transporter [Alicyclobacillus herbarius]|uniref:MMPL family transporter n=1 Tax=Alicyclobacillus herbarius TaxID=122960 RepID=UPI0004170208|nr:MMPL family transporter [Alicyclobacillus herbarius]